MDGFLAQILLALAAILAAARLLGALAVRLRQPRIGGEMLAGLLVGGALLSPWRHPGVAHHAAFLSTTVVRFIDLLGQVGVILYLLLVGLTLSPLELRRNATRIAAVGLPVIVAAAALAPLGAVWFGGARWQLAGGLAAGLVMAAALMINGFPFVARILQERELLHGGFGVTLLGASALVTALPFVLLWPNVDTRRVASWRWATRCLAIAGSKLQSSPIESRARDELDDALGRGARGENLSDAKSPQLRNVICRNRSADRHHDVVDLLST